MKEWNRVPGGGARGAARGARGSRGRPLRIVDGGSAGHAGMCMVHLFFLGAKFLYNLVCLYVSFSVCHTFLFGLINFSKEKNYYSVIIVIVIQ